VRRKHRVAHHKTAASVPLKSVCVRAEAELHATRVYKLLCIADAHSEAGTHSTEQQHRVQSDFWQSMLLFLAYYMVVRRHYTAYKWPGNINRQSGICQCQRRATFMRGEDKFQKPLYAAACATGFFRSFKTFTSSCCNLNNPTGYTKVLKYIRHKLSILHDTLRVQSAPAVLFLSRPSITLRWI
jgi:hypothetical protein